jgi:hypothetical protein
VSGESEDEQERGEKDGLDSTGSILVIFGTFPFTAFQRASTVFDDDDGVGGLLGDVSNRSDESDLGKQPAVHATGRSVR